jgi:hypothetical protein
MLPQVEKLTSLDMYRDGGSISASFQARDGASYTLFFKIHHWSDRAPPATYDFARLERYSPTVYTSPITGVSDPDWEKKTEAISWADARTLLDELTIHLDSFKSDHVWIFNEMKAAAMGDGIPEGRTRAPPNTSLERTRER